MIGNCPEVLTFNWLFLKLNRFFPFIYLEWIDIQDSTGIVVADQARKQGDPHNSGPHARSARLLCESMIINLEREGFLGQAIECSLLFIIINLTFFVWNALPESLQEQ